MEEQTLKPRYELNLWDDPLIPFRLHRAIIALPQAPQNWHENSEFIYCVSGEGYVTYNDRSIPISQGQLVAINSEMFHSVISQSGMCYHCVTLDRHFSRESGIPTTELFFRERIEDPQINKSFLAILDALEDYHSTGNTRLAAVVRARTLDFLYQLCRDHLVAESRGEHRLPSPMVRSVMTYIRKNLSSPMTLDEIARYAGVNKYHMSREFKRVVGRTVFDTVVQLRCAAAKDLIEGGSTVSQAARSCGFENLSYFTRAFKKYYQELPSRYLKKPEGGE